MKIDNNDWTSSNRTENPEVDIEKLMKISNDAQHINIDGNEDGFPYPNLHFGGMKIYLIKPGEHICISNTESKYGLIGVCKKCKEFICDPSKPGWVDGLCEKCAKNRED